MKKILLLSLLAVFALTTSCKKDAKDIVEPISEAEKAVKIKNMIQ